MTQTLTFFKDGEPITTNVKAEITSAMEIACASQGIDKDDMADCAKRLIESEEDRECFTDWTGIEVVLNIAETEIEI